jgi:hypothetical protein
MYAASAVDDNNSIGSGDLSSLGGSMKDKAAAVALRTQQETITDSSAIRDNNVSEIPHVKPELICDDQPNNLVEDSLSVDSKRMIISESAPNLLNKYSGKNSTKNNNNKNMSRTANNNVVKGSSSGGALKARMNLTGIGMTTTTTSSHKGKTSRDQLTLARMAKEIEMLVEQLDDGK